MWSKWEIDRINVDRQYIKILSSIKLSIDIQFLILILSMGHLMCRAQCYHRLQMMGLRPVRPNNQWVWSLRQEGIKGLGLCLLDLSHPFEKNRTSLSRSHCLREYSEKGGALHCSQKIHIVFIKRTMDSGQFGFYMVAFRKTFKA